MVDTGRTAAGLATSPTTKLSSDSPLRGAFISLLISGVAIAAVGMFGANFRTSADVLPTSLGGDFLQEWLGGYVIASGNVQQLYDSDYTFQLQHDESVVGFRWNATSYFPMVYPPAWYTNFCGLSSLDYRVACFLWLGVLALMFPITFLLANAWDSNRPYSPIIHTIALLMFPPVMQSIVMTQKSLLWLAILLGTFVLARRKRDWEAGAVFGLCIWKPTLVPVILVIMCLSGRWRFVMGSALSAGAIFLLSLSVVPISVWADYARVVLEAGSYHENIGYSSALAQNLGCVLQPFSGADRSVYWAMYLVAGSGIACLMFIIANAAAWNRNHADDEPPKISQDGFCLAAIIGTVLLSPHFYFYDLAILFVAGCAMRSFLPRSTTNLWTGVIYIVAVGNPMIVETLGVPLLPLVLVALLIATAMYAVGERTTKQSAISLSQEPT